MRELRRAGVGAVMASWWGPSWRPGTTDTQNVSTDAALPLLLEAAAGEGVRVAIHLEPYPGRTAATIREDLAHLRRLHGDAPALLRLEGRPLYFVSRKSGVSVCVSVCVGGCSAPAGRARRRARGGGSRPRQAAPASALLLSPHLFCTGLRLLPHCPCRLG